MRAGSAAELGLAVEQECQQRAFAADGTSRFFRARLADGV